MLMSGNRLLEWLPIRKAAEVKALAPAVLVQVRRKIVVVSRQGCVLLSPRLSRFSSLVRGGLVVPMSEVFVQCLLVCGVVLIEH